MTAVFAEAQRIFDALSLIKFFKNLKSLLKKETVYDRLSLLD